MRPLGAKIANIYATPERSGWRIKAERPEPAALSAGRQRRRPGRYFSLQGAAGYGAI